MKNKLFDTNIEIDRQNIRGLHYSTSFGQDLDFDKPLDLNYKFAYDVLKHKTIERDFIIILDLYISPANEIKSEQFHIIAEGHYSVHEEVPVESLSKAIHYTGLSSLLSFLRSSILSITSLSMRGGLVLPPVKIEELHRIHKESIRKRKTKPNTAT